MFQRNRDIDRRSRCLASGKRGKGPVVYWMSRDQRAEDNWAMLWAQQEALDRETGLRVVFCLVTDYPGATLPHYLFMLSGLRELQEKLIRYNITFEVLSGNPVEELPRYLQQYDAHVLVSDFDPLRFKAGWKSALLARVSTPFYEVDSHNIVPAWIASPKKEYAAYTLRPKIHRLLADYLTDIPALKSHPFSFGGNVPPIDTRHLVSKVHDRRTTVYAWLQPGEKSAQKAAHHAIEHRLPNYATMRNDPCVRGQSDLSPYLHFGQLSAQRLAWLVTHADLEPISREAFLEELIIRRELADNFCLYEQNYDRFEGFPDWAKKSLNEHRSDKREFLYPLSRLEEASTHDLLWNACQKDLRQTGKLHGFLRMYWAKKILEWTHGPEEAIACAIYLNDTYSLDGRDPNGYTGIAWSIGGVHDRAWQERPVFGKIRYMNDKGCRRKFNVQQYIRSVNDGLA